LNEALLPIPFRAQSGWIKKKQCVLRLVLDPAAGLAPLSFDLPNRVSVSPTPTACDLTFYFGYVISLIGNQLGIHAEDILDRASQFAVKYSNSCSMCGQTWNKRLQLLNILHGCHSNGNFITFLLLTSKWENSVIKYQPAKSFA
jgi:hypothetical protein